MFERLEKGELALGSDTLTHGVEWLEVLGQAGLDFACVDMMVTSIDWGHVADMVRACSRYGMTPWVRVQAFPWHGSGFDPRLSSDVLRAVSLGAEAITASVNTAEEVSAMVAALRAGHRRPYVWKPFAGAWEPPVDVEPIVFPLLESLEAVNNVDEMLDVDGVAAVFVGMGDLTRLLGHHGDDRHADVRAMIKDVVRKARNRGKFVICNFWALHRPDAITPEYSAEKIEWLHDAGVSVVWMPGMHWVVQRFYERVLDCVSDRSLKEPVVD